MIVRERTTEIPSLRGKVVVVDDGLAIRGYAAGLLRSAGYVVESFQDPRAVRDQLHGSGPCCLVLDVRMPQLDGLALMDDLVHAGLDPQVVFVTGQADVPTATAAMKRGAVDFLVTPVDRTALVDAVERAIARDQAARAVRSARDQAQALIRKLTSREREVCELVARGLLNKQIAGELGTAEKTAKVHRERALKKLGIGSVAELVRLLDRAGDLVHRAELEAMHGPAR